jgi:plastocyanin
MKNAMWAGTAALSFLVACGQDTSGATGGTRCTPGATAAVAIAASGVTPKAVCMLPGGTVTFSNSDTVAHDIQSGAGCPLLNLGPIAAQASATATLPTVATCAYHDENDPTNAAFQGTVAVTNAPVGGPGY